MGPGFDTLGMALDLWSEFAVERADRFEVLCLDDASKHMPLDESNLICVGVAAAFKKAGQPLPVLRYQLRNGIPHARGLGSSSAAIVGGLLAGMMLAGAAWTAEELFSLAAELEGHPDNVAAAIFGGIQLGIHDGHRWINQRISLPSDLQCVCYIPNAIGKTSAARAVLADTVARQDAVFNIGRVAWLVNALATNNLAQLRFGMQDALHQPQRAATVYPHLTGVLASAMDAGALAAFLSGAGPTVMALTSRSADCSEKVAEAMLAAAVAADTDGQVLHILPIAHGAYVCDIS